MQSLQVDSVQRWMEDLRHMTEVECMCVLQAKPIGVEEDAQQGELIVASGVGAGDHVARNNLQTLLRRALVVSTELGKMFQRLEKGRWQRVHSTAVRANCHVRSLVHEYSAARSTPPEMQKVRAAGTVLSVWTFREGGSIPAQHDTTSLSWPDMHLCEQTE